MFAGGLVDLLVDRQESLTGSPVHLADELTTKCVDDASNGWRFSLTDEVEVQHALDSSWLQTIDEASCLVVEEGVFGKGAQRSAWGRESLNLVIGGHVWLVAIDSVCRT